MSNIYHVIPIQELIIQMNSMEGMRNETSWL